MNFSKITVDWDVSGGEPDTRVVNLGTKEQPNYAGPAYAVGRMRGIREALDAVRARQAVNGGDNIYPEEIGRNDAYDDCVDAIEELLS